MAKPLQYPKSRVVSLSDDTDQMLIRRAQELKTKPAVLARNILSNVLRVDTNFRKYQEEKNVKSKKMAR